MKQKKIIKYRKKIESELMKDYLDSGKKTLDVGGEGYYSFMFKDIHTCNIIENSDLPNFKYCDLNKSRLPYNDNEFDSVLLTHVLEHLENIFFVLRECKRVLKPNGRLFVSIPNPDTLISKLKFLFFDRVGTVSDTSISGGHINVVMPCVLKSYIKKNLSMKIIHESYNGGIIPIIRLNVKKSKLFGKNYTLVAMK